MNFPRGMASINATRGGRKKILLRGCCCCYCCYSGVGTGIEGYSFFLAHSLSLARSYTHAHTEAINLRSIAGGLSGRAAGEFIYPGLCECVCVCMPVLFFLRSFHFPPRRARSRLHCSPGRFGFLYRVLSFAPSLYPRCACNLKLYILFQSSSSPSSSS